MAVALCTVPNASDERQTVPDDPRSSIRTMF